METLKFQYLMQFFTECEITVNRFLVGGEIRLCTPPYKKIKAEVNEKEEEER